MLKVIFNKMEKIILKYTQYIYIYLYYKNLIKNIFGIIFCI